MAFLALLDRIVIRLARTIATAELQQQIFRVDELIARIVRRRVDPSVHADRVAGASFDAESTEDAAELVDHELLRVALETTPLVTFGVLCRLDVDALRRAGRRATQTRHAARRTIVALSEPVHPAEA